MDKLRHLVLLVWSKLMHLAKNENLRQLFNYLSFISTILVFVLLLVHNWGKLNEYDDWIAYVSVAGIGFLLYPISLGIQALTWQLIVYRLGAARRGWWDLEIYAYTHMTKRLPSPLWYLVGRATKYHTLGVSSAIIIASSGLEWLLLLVSAGGVYLGFFIARGSNLIFILLLTVVLLMLYALLLVWILKKSHHLKNLPLVDGRLDFTEDIRIPHLADVFLWLLLYASCYIIGGGIVYALAYGISEDSVIEFVTAVQVWSLTGGIGFLLSIFIPLGFGLRELTLGTLLTSYTSTTISVLIAIILRLLFISGDLFWGGVFWITARLAQKCQEGHFR
jgi:hypothetical protein